jgi:hypothetical protein
MHDSMLLSRYFGTTGFAELSSALTVATGSDQGLLDANPDFYKTGMYHMYVTGMTSLFNYVSCPVCLPRSGFLNGKGGESV